MNLIIASAKAQQEQWRWTSNGGYDGKASFVGAQGYSMSDKVLKDQAANFGWNKESSAAGDFDYIEAQQFAFSKEDGRAAAYIQFTVATPNSEGGKYRVYIGSNLYGDFPSSGWDWTSKKPTVDYKAWKDYSMMNESDTPAPVHASIVSYKDDGTPRGNRHLMLFISFRSTPATQNCDRSQAHCCYVNTDVSGQQTYARGLDDAAQNCKIVPPSYRCGWAADINGYRGFYKGSLAEMQDGLPINVFFMDNAELGLGITNRMWGFELENTSDCETLR